MFDVVGYGWTLPDDNANRGYRKKIPMWIYINTCLFFDFERDHIVSFSEIFDMCRLCFKLG